jgi:excisionase family DNA binding protein
MSVARRQGPAVDDREVIGLYVDQGLTAAQVAARLGISRSGVALVLDRHRVPRRPRGRRPQIVEAETERQIIDRYVGGLSLREAGEPFGAGHSAVRAVLNRYGVARRAQGRPRKAARAGSPPGGGDGDRVLRVSEVAAVLRVSKATIYRLIASGELDALQIGPRGLRVGASVLHDYVAARGWSAGSALGAVAGLSRGTEPAVPLAEVRPARCGVWHLRTRDLAVALAGEVTTVGRGVGCDVRLDDPSVGLLHAELVRRGPYVYVSSLTGPEGATRVNGHAAARQVLAGGDVVSFGHVACTIFSDGDTERGEGSLSVREHGASSAAG